MEQDANIDELLDEDSRVDRSSECWDDISVFDTSSDSDNDVVVIDDSDDDFIEEGALACIASASAELINSREGFYARQRLIWSEHIQKLRREKKFNRAYRMDEWHFDRLVALLEADLAVDGVMSTRRTGVAPISAEVALHCTLRYLAGGSYLDVRNVAQISVPSLYRCLHKGISEILRCPDLAFKLPATAYVIDRTAAEFKSDSTEGVLDGCVGCVDGMLVIIVTPSRKEAGNVRAYFLGHYHHMGLNVQAACDNSCRFIYFAVAAPGGSSDLWAFKRTKLAGFVDQLGPNRYLIGDGAYIPSEHMLTPFGGPGKINPTHDTFDFYIGQLRIKIEQTFGRLANKWRCLKAPMVLSLKNTSRALMARARLHNFCADLGEAFVTVEAREDSIDDQTASGGRQGLAFLPSEPLEQGSYSIPGVSNLRERIVAFIESASLSRPHRNLVRRTELSE